jgi:alpha-N-arabinofuranosidase
LPLSTATVTVHPDFSRGEIDRRIFGSFVEHMGRCVYTGIYEPGHPSADAGGFRRDVAELVDELGVTAVRYPGGNFVSGYDWRDGIGPVHQRPTRLDLAWRSIEPNLVGVDEFLPWAAARGLDPIMAVNLGTAGVREAAELVEYCNLAEGTSLVRQRTANGRASAYGIKTWCLGNEMDGPWQIGHASAAEYGQRAAEAGKAMRQVDPSIELVACGSSFRHMPTFGSWEATVAELTADVADYMSMHAYYDGLQDRRDFLVSGHRLDRFVADVVATCDAVSAKLNSARRMQISLDEWNVWSCAAAASPVGQTRDISHAPRITEDTYQALDAVVLGDLIVSILNHADRVRIGCLSLLVNVSAPIITEPGGTVHKQSIFHPFAAAAGLARGEALMTKVRAPEYRAPTHGVVPAVAVAATYDHLSGTAAMFLTNRAAEAIECSIQHGAFEQFDIGSVHALACADSRPIRDLSLLPVTEVATGRRVSTVVLPAESWTAIQVSAKA